MLLLTQNNQLIILGAGSYGTALAVLAARNQQNVVLVTRTEAQAQEMRKSRKNNKYLPSCLFPDNLQIASHLNDLTLQNATFLIATPSHVFKQTLLELQPFFKKEEHFLAWVTKGLDPDNAELLSDIVIKHFGNIPMAMLSGPTFAAEIAKGLPTAITLSSNDKSLSKTLKNFFSCIRSFRIYLNDDLIGVQLAASVKNVLAIATGISDGLSFGVNARSALITRGLQEMIRLGEAYSANPDTFVGMAGLGDLVLTCTDNQSRNRRFGIAIGQGKTTQEALTDIQQIVEGYKNTKEIYLIAQRLGLELPICHQVYRVLYENVSAKLAAENLLSRPLKSENKKNT